jgi:hypothetical protein
VPLDAEPVEDVTYEPPMRPLPPEMIAHQWKPGHSGNPSGKLPLSRCGRQAALSLLDEILSEQETKARMKQALRAYILQRPVAAFKTLVMPLLPKDVRVDVSSQRVVVWRSFMEEVGITPSETADISTRH